MSSDPPHRTDPTDVAGLLDLVHSLRYANDELYREKLVHANEAKRLRDTLEQAELVYQRLVTLYQRLVEISHRLLDMAGLAYPESVVNLRQQLAELDTLAQGLR